MRQTTNRESFLRYLDAVLAAQRYAETGSLEDMRVSLNDVLRHAEDAAIHPNRRRVFEIIRLGTVRAHEMARPMQVQS
jgi:hypothetical protein